MLFSIVIPAYNESHRIEKTLDSLALYFKSNLPEIIVINDGSTDNTLSLLKKKKKEIPTLRILSNPKNQGKGFSVRKGVLNSSGDLVLFTDADLSTPITELDKLKKEYNKGFKIVVGSRRLAGSKIIVFQPRYRQLLGKLFSTLVNITTTQKIKDTQCGFKLFDSKVAKHLFKMQKIKGFSFDVEILYLAQKKGIKIKEVPVIWKDSSKYSKVNPLQDSVKMLLDLIKIRLIHF